MNQYHIYEAIGRGKYSTVYNGRKKKTIEYYAVKSVDKSQKSKVLQEVRILHSLYHPNILRFYSWYGTSAHLWLVLEYCVGGDLMNLLLQRFLTYEVELAKSNEKNVSGLGIRVPDLALQRMSKGSHYRLSYLPPQSHRHPGAVEPRHSTPAVAAAGSSCSWLFL